MSHECVFAEEQEPTGRLILPPCLVCGLTAMDALTQQRQIIGRAETLRDDWAFRYGDGMVGVKALTEALQVTPVVDVEPYITCGVCGADILTQGYLCCPRPTLEGE